MQTKLTLRLEQRLIRRAEAYARRTGKSVSELVAAVQSLVGALAGSRVDEADYRAHQVEKHR